MLEIGTALLVVLLTWLAYAALYVRRHDDPEVKSYVRDHLKANSEHLPPQSDTLDTGEPFHRTDGEASGARDDDDPHATPLEVLPLPPTSDPTPERALGGDAVAIQEGGATVTVAASDDSNATVDAEETHHVSPGPAADSDKGSGDDVEALKRRGNDAMAAGNLTGAEALYGAALALAPCHGASRNNRAACRLALGDWAGAAADAAAVLAFDGANLKASVRRAVALERLGGDANVLEALRGVQVQAKGAGLTSLGRGVRC